MTTPPQSPNLMSRYYAAKEQFGMYFQFGLRCNKPIEVALDDRMCEQVNPTRFIHVEDSIIINIILFCSMDNFKIITKKIFGRKGK